MLKKFPDYLKKTPIKNDAKLGTYVSSDVVVGALVVSREAGKQVPKTIIETLNTSVLLPANSNNTKNYEIVISDEGLTNFMKNNNPFSFKEKTKIGNIAIDNSVKYFLEIMSTNRESSKYSQLFEKISEDTYRVLPWYKDVMRAKVTHKGLYSSYRSIDILKKTRGAKAATELELFYTLLSCFHMTSGEDNTFCSTHELTEEILYLDRNKVKKLSDSYGVKIVPVNRKPTDQEKFELELHNKCVYADDEVIPVGYKIVDGKNTIKDAMEAIRIGVFDGKLKINNRVLLTIITRIANRKHFYTHDNFKKSRLRQSKKVRDLLKDVKGRYIQPDMLPEGIIAGSVKAKATIYTQAFVHVSDSKKFSLQKFIHDTNSRRRSLFDIHLQQQANFYREVFNGEWTIDRQFVVNLKKSFNEKYLYELGRTFAPSQFCVTGKDLYL